MRPDSIELENIGAMTARKLHALDSADPIYRHGGGRTTAFGFASDGKRRNAR